MTLASTIDHAISQLQTLRKQADELDKVQQQSTAFKSKLADLEDEVKRSEATKAKLLSEITVQKQQLEQLRAEKLAEREARQKIVNEANVKIRELGEEIAKKQGQRDEISGAISQLKSKFG